MIWIIIWILSMPLAFMQAGKKAELALNFGIEPDAIVMIVTLCPVVNTIASIQWIREWIS